MGHTKKSQHIWILFAESFPMVVSELSQPFRFVRESIVCVFILEVQSSCMHGGVLFLIVVFCLLVSLLSSRAVLGMKHLWRQKCTYLNDDNKLCQFIFIARHYNSLLSRNVPSQQNKRRTRGQSDWPCCNRGNGQNRFGENLARIMFIVLSEFCTKSLGI